MTSCIFNKHKTDMEIPSRVWNTYLTKYKEKYRVHINGKNNEYIMSIWCKPKEKHFIQPYSIVKKQLVFVGTFNSPKGITYLKRKLPNYCKVVFETETEINVVFPESKIEELVNILKIYRRKKLSKENIKILKKNLAQAGKKTQIQHKRPTKGIILKNHLKTFCVYFLSFLWVYFLKMEGSLNHFDVRMGFFIMNQIILI